jgi:hypothetical protein
MQISKEMILKALKWLSILAVMQTASGLGEENSGFYCATLTKPVIV